VGLYGRYFYIVWKTACVLGAAEKAESSSFRNAPQAACGEPALV
jgi:hypothetical protein